MLVVAALGGNALVRRGQPTTAGVQRSNIAVAAAALAPIARQHRLIVTHGNGPQVGLLALQNEAYSATDAYPLDILDAETEGMVGYLLESELGRHLPARRVATLLSQIEVDPRDPAFGRPQKFVGPVYDEARARQLARDRGWDIAADGTGWRRVVASPEPRRIVGIDAIRLLSENEYTVICAGGGGIPVARDESDLLRGCEAVIDKDLASARLAIDIGAEALILLTDVDAVHDGWGTEHSRPIGTATVAQMRTRSYPPGSMGPKVEAACRFAEQHTGIAAIGSLAAAGSILAGTSGTRILGRS